MDAAAWKWGVPSTAEVRTIPLWWNTLPIAVDSDGRLATPPTPAWMRKHGCTGPIVYAIEGCLDVQLGRAILYVGESTGGDDRVPTSLARVIDGQYGALYSNVTDVLVRWAQVEEAIREDVEVALIAAHSPALNSLGVGKEYKRPQITVFNAGAKGRLVGVVDSRYFTQGPYWPKSPPSR